MRVAPQLLLTTSRWSPRSLKSVSYSQTRLVRFQKIHELSQPAGSSPRTLARLERLSQEKGPFVFHLPSDDPYLNLSIEHHLLNKSHPESHILLFYTNRPCVVLGRNQNPWLETDLKRIQAGLTYASPLHNGREPRRECPRVPVDLVRRRSGGGTVFHDSGNLNFSVIVPNNKSFTRDKHAEMIVQALRTFESRRWSDPMPQVRVNERHDIVMQRPQEKEWLKVSGSAYKLTKGRALHHGTLLFSSPYIRRISDLLRSPGQGFITAAGVGSVRSKVGNLFGSSDEQERTRLRGDITQAIVRQFWTMYGAGQAREIDVNEVTVPFPSSVDELARQSPSVAQGVRELRSEAWIFEQTPKFTFRSGSLDGHELEFHADKGVLRSMTLKYNAAQGAEQTSDEDGPEEYTREFEVPKGAVLNDVAAAHKDVIKLHEVRDWVSLVTDRVVAGGNGEESPQSSVGKLPKALIQRIEAIFPAYQPEAQR
jgi:lipoate---protein ligase